MDQNSLRVYRLHELYRELCVVDLRCLVLKAKSSGSKPRQLVLHARRRLVIGIKEMGGVD